MSTETEVNVTEATNTEAPNAETANAEATNAAATNATVTNATVTNAMAENAEVTNAEASATETDEVNAKPKVESKYRVESVEKIEPPEGMPAGNWHRYVIGQGGSKIDGLKPGTLKAVTEHAESVATDLNLRATGGNSTYAARKQK